MSEASALPAPTQPLVESGPKPLSQAVRRGYRVTVGLLMADRSGRGANGSERVEATPTHGVPNVLNGLEVLLHRGLADWMERVTPRSEWDLAISEKTGRPQWWARFREDVRAAYRDAANRFSRAVLKKQIDDALSQLGITNTLLAQLALVSDQNYYQTFDDFTASGETVVNTARAFLQSRGVLVKDPDFERFREAGVCGAMRYIRYRYLRDDEWYSTWHLEREKKAKAKKTKKTKRSACADAVEEEKDAPSGGRYLKDWVITAPPHFIVLPALRAVILRKQGLRPSPPISPESASQAWNSVIGELKEDDHKSPPEWFPSKDEGATRLARELAVWHAPFALTVFCVDPLRLTNQPQ